MIDPKTPAPIRRTLNVGESDSLGWCPRADGGLALTINNVTVALTAEEVEWFLNDLRALKPPGSVYRDSGSGDKR